MQNSVKHIEYHSVQLYFSIRCWWFYVRGTANTRVYVTDAVNSIVICR